MKMKKSLFILSMSLLALTGLSSCGESNTTKTIPTPIPGTGDMKAMPVLDGNIIGDGTNAYEVKGGKYLLKKGTYVMKGWIYVTKGSSLTIEPGTVIKGDKATKAALVVEPGAQIYAQGTPDAPIVFTSNQPKGMRKPGDWGGIILCGNARNNQGTATIEGGLRTKFGGDNDEDNSGVLSYVRIEFAGTPFTPDNEINGLTLGSVGSKTKLDHIQVSHSNDDSFEWFGGTVNATHLIAYRGWDDDFDTDFGYSGKVQFALSVRDGRIADGSYSNSFESDNDGSGSTKAPYTSAVFSNVTLIGPMVNNPDFKNNNTYINADGNAPNNGSKLGLFQSAIQIRRNSHLSIFNSVIAGWPVGIIIENDKGSATQGAATTGELKVQNILMAQVGILGTDVNKKLVSVYSTDGGINTDNTKTPFSIEYFLLPINKNKSMASYSDLKLNATYMPEAGSPVLNAASFIDTKLKGLSSVAYAGAFAQNDSWAAKWTNFDPQNTAY